NRRELGSCIERLRPDSEEDLELGLAFEARPHAEVEGEPQPYEPENVGEAAEGIPDGPTLVGLEPDPDRPRELQGQPEDALAADLTRPEAAQRALAARIEELGEGHDGLRIVLVENRDERRLARHREHAAIAEHVGGERQRSTPRDPARPGDAAEAYVLLRE